MHADIAAQLHIVQHLQERKRHAGLQIGCLFFSGHDLGQQAEQAAVPVEVHQQCPGFLHHGGNGKLVISDRDVSAIDLLLCRGGHIALQPAGDVQGELFHVGFCLFLPGLAGTADFGYHVQQ